MRMVIDGLVKRRAAGFVPNASESSDLKLRITNFLSQSMRKLSSKPILMDLENSIYRSLLWYLSIFILVMR